MGYKTDKYIAQNGNRLAIIIAIILFVWFVGGLILVDILPIYIFLPLWVPIGLLGYWFASKW